MFRDAKTFQDKIAAGFVKFLRYAGRPRPQFPSDHGHALTSTYLRPDGDLTSFPGISTSRSRPILQ